MPKQFRASLIKVLRRFSFGLSDHSDSTWNEFYDRFESRFRGSADLLKSRFESRYRERLVSLLQQSASGNTPRLLDLGCGRGEFLDFAKALGFETGGVDSSSAAVKTAQFEHEIVVGDLLAYLRKQPSESATAITCFHVIEHIPPRICRNLFIDAIRVLKPGGVFLVETPSLNSAIVASRQFFLDPTHKFPVHPEYLAFLAADCGFAPAELLEFEEFQGAERASLSANAAAKSKAEFQKLERWLYGPMDLALWAVKP